MKFWKEHAALRVALLIILLVLGGAGILVGWRMTGTLKGLAVMLLGLALLLVALKVYNKPFE
jgi:hypothetical protein